MADTQPSGITREGSEPQAGKWPSVDRPSPPELRVYYPGAGSEAFHGINEKSKGNK
jgi:hypothetical protein